jgi:galactokinase
MTGGGFGGCIVALVQRSKAQDVITYILKRYRDQCGKEGTAYTTRPGQGASVVAAPDVGF